MSKEQTGGQELFDGAYAQRAVIGAMLIDDRCVHDVLSRLRPEDFIDQTCRATFRAIQRLTLEGKPVDPVTVVDAMSGGESYVQWLRGAMDDTPTAANVLYHAEITRRNATSYQLRCLADKLLASCDLDEQQETVRKMSGLLSAASRMPRMTGAELARDFLERMGSKSKPEYLPWGLPTANREVYAELGDMILLGGYSSSGKTLLSILMALAQAKRYKVGYYSLETQPAKMADRIFSHLSGVTLGNIKRREFDAGLWTQMAEATTHYVTDCPFDIIQAAGSSVDDIATDAVARGYQIIYVDYLQLIEAPGIRSGDNYARVSAVSRALKVFAQSTNTAVVALAQFSRPERIGKGDSKKSIPPNMQSFRDSGQIEQDADAAFLLWPEDPDDNQSRRVLKLGKNKEGGKFKISLSFDGATQTMVEVAEGNVAAELAQAGREAKRKLRNKPSDQVSFRELRGGSSDNPFEEGN